MLFDENEAFNRAEIGLLDAAGIMFAVNGVLQQIEEHITPSGRETLISSRITVSWEDQEVDMGGQL